MLRADEKKNPMTHFDYDTFSRLLRNNPTEAEAYRKRVTGEDKIPQAELIISEDKTITEQSQEILNSDTITKEQTAKLPQVIDMDKVRQALKEKGVKGVHFIKSNDKLMEKAREHKVL